MAGKGSKSTSKPYKWLGHIQVYFNDQERDNAIAYVDGRSAPFQDIVSNITQAECGIKFTYSGFKDCYQVTLQPKDKSCYLYGYTLGFIHEDLLRLCQICAYILFEMVEHEAIEIPSNSTIATW